MDLTSPLADLIPGARGRLLTSLVQLERPVSVRSLAGRAGVSPQRALELAHDLEQAGIASIDDTGHALLVSLNGDHVAAAPLRALAKVRAELIARLAAAVKDCPGAVGAWLFGSAARGDGGRGSDVDVLLVAEGRPGAAWTDAVDRLRHDAHSWTGNPVQILEHTTRSLSQLVRADNPLVAALRLEGIPLLPGSDRLLQERR